MVVAVAVRVWGRNLVVVAESLRILRERVIPQRRGAASDVALGTATDYLVVRSALADSAYRVLLVTCVVLQHSGSLGPSVPRIVAGALGLRGLIVALLESL